MADTIILEREAFRSGWKTVAKGGSKVMTVYNNVLLETLQESVRLTSFDMTAAIRKTIPARGPEGLRLTLPQDQVKALLTSLPAGPVSLQAQERLVILKSGRGEYRLPGVSPDDFSVPLIQEDPEKAFQVKASDLLSVLNAVSYATGLDQTRPYMCGVLLRWSPEAGLTAAATDGHRLAVSQLPLAIPCQGEVILPTSTANNLAADLAASPTADVTVTTDGRMFQAAYGETSVTVTIISGQYPAYERVIPAGAPKTRVVVEREEFLTTLKRMGALLSADAPRLLLKNAGLLLEGQVSQIDGAQAREEIVPIQLEGELCEVTVNQKYMVQALGAVEAETVEIGFHGALSPVTIRPVGEPGQLHLMAPMADARP